MIEKRLSSLSSDENEFQKVKEHYQNALNNSGYKHDLKFKLPQNRGRRQRNIIWFNPPFSQSVKTDIGRKFLWLVKKYFPSLYTVKLFKTRPTSPLPRRGTP